MKHKIGHHGTKNRWTEKGGINAIVICRPKRKKIVKEGKEKGEEEKRQDKERKHNGRAKE